MLETAKYSSRGGRDYNEDTVELFVSKGRCCVVLADGLGGQGGGKAASETAAALILREAAALETFSVEPVLELFQKANQAVLQQQTNTCKMQTTAVGLFVDSGRADWAHVGDSRLYHFVDGQMAGMTLDHSVSQLAVYTGEITQRQVRFHTDRNKVLRALGAEADVKPSFDHADLDDGAFHAFLLCSDGFWEYVLEGEMEIDLAKAAEPKDWIRCMTERLEARVDGRNDNFSAAAVFYCNP